MTRFQINALRAIINIGSVYIKNDTSDARKIFENKRKDRRGNSSIVTDKAGNRIAIPASDETIGYVGLPTIKALTDLSFLQRDPETSAISAT